MASKAVVHSRASDVLVSHHNEICKVLTVSETTLLSLTGELYQKRFVDFYTKSEVISKGGYKGADTLMDYLVIKVDQNPDRLYIVLEAMREQEVLNDIVKKMDSWKGEDMADSPVLNVTKEVDKLDTVKEAEDLKQVFEELLVFIVKLIVGVDLDNLKVRISWFFNDAKEITGDVQEILDQLQSLQTPQKILTFLITRNFIGYLNYQLLKVFQKAVESSEMKAKIEEYEEMHDAFLSHFSFNSIIEAFKTNRYLAPVSTIGLPKFTVKLQDPWEGKSVYEWKEVLDKNFAWSSHLIVVSLKKNCIVLTYAVLPFFTSSVVRDLENPSVIKRLEIEGVSMELSDLLKSEKHDDKLPVMKELEVGMKYETVPEENLKVLSHMLVTGKTGVGKSSLTNALIGEKKAIEGKDLNGVTREVTFYEATVSDLRLNVWDTPGLQGITKRDDEVTSRIRGELQKSFADLNLLLYCIRIDRDDVQQSEFDAMKQLSVAFSVQIWDIAVFALTFANRVVPPNDLETEEEDIEWFKERTKYFKEKIVRALVKIGVPEIKAKQIPFIPTGYHTPTRVMPNPRILLDGSDWLNNFWLSCANRILTNPAKSLLLASQKNCILHSGIKASEEAEKLQVENLGEAPQTKPSEWKIDISTSSDLQLLYQALEQSVP